MKSFVTVMLVVLVSASLAAVACGELVYMDRRNNPPLDDGVLELRGSDGSVLKTYADDLPIYPEGLGLSPSGDTLYMAFQAGHLRVYDTATGVLNATWNIGIGAIGVAVDGDGNIYCSAMNGYIVKFSSDGLTRDDTWGNRLGTNVRMADIEIYDGKLYGAGQTQTTSGKGIYYWDLSWDPDEGSAPVTLLGETDGLNYDGLAFAPDGTLYTSKASEFNVRKWNADYTSSEFLLDPDSDRRPNDIDYYDGYLYVASRFQDSHVQDAPGQIRKIDLSAENPVEATWVTVPTPATMPRYLVITEIPEPSTLALLATGLIGLLAYAWRKRK